MANFVYRGTYMGHRSVPAEVAGVELARLAGSGDLTASRVGEAARPEGAPLHGEFTWDTEKAAHQFNLIEARHLIRAVVRMVEDDPQEIPYVHVPGLGKGEGKYVALNVVVEQVDEFERALGSARQDLASAERRFHELRRLAEVRGGQTEVLAIAAQGFAAVDQALAMLH
jgi:hypothetical protein